MQITHPLHERAVRTAKDFLRSETALIGVLQEIEKDKLYLGWDFPSLYQYAMRALGLTDDQASSFIRISRKCTELPALKAALDAGEVTASKVHRIVKVIEKSNAEEWIQKAATLPKRELERQVAALNPETQVRETIKPLFKDRSELRCGMTPDMETKLERLRALLAQSTGRHCGIEDALDVAISDSLERRDPIKKAERAKERQARISNASSQKKPQAATSPTYRRRPVMAMPIRHEVWLRDGGRCQYKCDNGKPCGSMQWVEVHHKIPVSQGGSNTPGNLITLCSYHHRLSHDFHADWKKRTGYISPTSPRSQPR